jgi:hypothetical protein
MSKKKIVTGVLEAGKAEEAARGVLRALGVVQV